MKFLIFVFVFIFIFGLIQPTFEYRSYFNRNRNSRVHIAHIARVECRRGFVNIGGRCRRYFSSGNRHRNHGKLANN